MIKIGFTVTCRASVHSRDTAWIETLQWAFNKVLVDSKHIIIPMALRVRSTLSLITYYCLNDGFRLSVVYRTYENHHVLVFPWWIRSNHHRASRVEWWVLWLKKILPFYVGNFQFSKQNVDYLITKRNVT